MDREQGGRLVREAWVNYCRETGDTKSSHLAPWDELSAWDKAADSRIYDAVAAALQAEHAAEVARLREALGTLTTVLVRPVNQAYGLCCPYCDAALRLGKHGHYAGCPVLAALNVVEMPAAPRSGEGE